MLRPTISGFNLLEMLGDGLMSSVYKAVSNDASSDLVTIKFLKKNIKNEDQKRFLSQRVERLKIIHDPHVITPYSIEFHRDRQVIVQPFVSGSSLDILFGAPVSLSVFFELASELCLAISAVHEAGIIHGAIKPHNILIQPKTHSVKLIDLLSPVPVQELSNFIYDADFVEHTLAYTSPEQTGRINHRIEFSTDIYSLGIIFYKLLTGELPFSSTDPLELIHSHLAEEAPAVYQVNPIIPEILGQIISKMVSKEPEKRYQTSMGLYADIKKCEAVYKLTPPNNIFPLGTHDRTRRVVFISKMMGRDNEAKTILEEYAKVAKGDGFHPIFIAGLPGIGKTRLIQELQQPLIKSHGYFTSGKFDLYQKNIPYSSLIQAFRSHIRTLLTESDLRVAKHKQKILSALGHQGKVITDVIPELSLLTDEQPDVPSLPPVESRNRFNNLFGSFLSSLSSKENPLILFIDDLQWCDSATFDFLNFLFSNKDDYPNLFFIGAYRDNEVSDSHPLIHLIERVKTQKRNLKEIKLNPLDLEACHEIVAYILNVPLEQTEYLGAFLAKLSEGNPLFVSESLSWLHNEKLLIFNEQGQWAWDMEKISSSNIPKSVVGMFGAKVAELQPDTLEVIKICACMGNNFSVEDIASICGLSLTALFKLLEPVLVFGLLYENKTRFQFVHDRVQEAVLEKLSAEDRRIIHWRVGTYLLGNSPVDSRLEDDDNLFFLAAHLNLGMPANLSSEEATKLAKINFHAGNKALKVLATQAANEYFQKGLNLLQEGSWDSNYKLMFQLHRNLAKTELMCGRYERSEALLNELLARSADDLDRAESLAEQTTSLSSVGNFIKAIDTANRGLTYFSKQIPVEDELAAKQTEILLQKIDEEHEDVWGRILNMPFTTDRESKIELAFYSELIPDLYMSGLVPQLYLSAAQSTIHCLQGGMDESVIYSFSIMGLNFGTKGQFEKAFRYEDLAHDLCARYPDTFGATRGINGIVWCNMHSRSHPRDIISYCLKGIQSGKNCGDLYNAGLCYGPLMWNSQVQGANFQELETIADKCLDFSEKNQLQFSIALAEAVQAGWLKPMKGTRVDTNWIAAKLASWKNSNYVAAAGSYYVLLGISHYYLGRYDEAVASFETVREFLSGMTDNVLKRQWYVFTILAALRNKSNSNETVDELQTRLASKLEQLKIWASLGPLLKPYLALCEAEWSRRFSTPSNTRMLYLEAIELARANGYIFLDGFINELFADFLKKEAWSSSEQYLNIALERYRDCGCNAKEQYLLSLYPGKLKNQIADEHSYSDGNIEQTVLPDLDIDYLIKWSHALSVEIEKEALLSTIAKLILECSGAQHGYLLQKAEDNWQIICESHTSKNTTKRNLPSPLDATTEICQGIIHLVSRSKEIVVLDDAKLSEEFKNIKDVTEYSIRSLLCLPILYQTELIGVLYLENRLSPGIFTPERVRLVELLSRQMAISIKNVYLLEEQKMQQENLLRTQKMEALGNLTGGIAHDYNNMLGVIMGYAEIMSWEIAEHPELASSQLAEYAKAIQHATKRGADLTHKLLAFSRGRRSQAKEIDLNAQIRGTEFMLKRTLTARIELILNLGDNLWPVLVDCGDLEDSIINISINAMHAIEGNGKLTILTGNTQLGFIEANRLGLPLGDYVMLSFSDNGCGMDESVTSRIFEPFFSTKSEKGTGLGLSQVYGFANRSHGAVDVDSHLGVGSNFTLFFPRHIENSQSGRLTQQPAKLDTTGHETILIVDDEPALISLSRDILTRQGYKILTAENGQQALQILEQTNVDLVFSDIIMPVMDGYQLAKNIQVKYPKIKIQLTSGYSGDPDEEIANSQLHMNILKKPYTSEAMLQVIRTMLDETLDERKVH